MAQWASDIGYRVDLGPLQLGDEEKGVCVRCSVATTEGNPWIHQLAAILFLDESDFRMT